MVNITNVNITEIQQLTGLYDAVQWVNVYSGGIFMYLFMFAIFFILIITQRAQGAPQAITLSSFVCFGLSLILGSLGIVQFSMVIGFFILTVLGAFYIYFSQNMSQS